MTKLIDIKKVDTDKGFTRVVIQLNPSDDPESVEWNEWLVAEEGKLLQKVSDLDDAPPNTPKESYIFELDLVTNAVVGTTLSYLQTIGSPYFKRESYQRFDHSISHEIYRCLKTLQLHWY